MSYTKQTVYTPEMDCGLSLEGKACMSANFWIPKTQVPNYQAILAAATVRTVTGAGEEIIYSLGYEIGDYVALARHFMDWGKHLSEWYEPDITYEPHTYEDRITIRDDAQEKAWQAFKDADHGVLNLACGKGKALAHGEPVITDRGEVLIEHITVGDLVAAPDGRFYPVLGVFPQGKRAIFRMSFTDGSHVDCDEQHLWTLVKPRDYGKEVTLTVKELMHEQLRGASGRKFFLPTVSPVEWEKRALPVDPYTLGALLGDGHLSIGTRVLFTTMDTGILNEMQLPARHRFKKLKHQNSGRATTYSVATAVQDVGKVTSILGLLRGLGLMGTTSHTKFIPTDYLYTCVADRVALLQGLLDTDGSPANGGVAEYCTVSEQLKDGVCRLVTSLGGTSTVQTRKDHYRCRVKLPSGVDLFRLERKQRKLATARQREPYRALEAITPIGVAEATCITVASPGSLFLTRLCVPTHNTVLALKKIARNGTAALVVVNMDGLFDQWKKQAMALLGIAEEDIGIVKGPKGQWDKPFVIASIHTLANRAEDLPEWVKQKFGIIIFDEAHHIPAVTFVKTAACFYGQRFGLTATPEREDNLEPVYFAHIGGVFYTDLKSEVESSISFKPIQTRVDMSDPVVKKLVTNRTGDVDTNRLRRYFSMLPERNAIILNDCANFLAEGRKVLVLTHVQDHPDRLVELAKATGRFDKYRLGSVSGAVKGKLRIPIIEASDLTFATFGTAREALDVDTLDTLICVTPFKAWGYMQQSKGRIERMLKGKKPPIAIIYEEPLVKQARGMSYQLRRRLRAKGFTFAVQAASARHSYREV